MLIIKGSLPTNRNPVPNFSSRLEPQYSSAQPSRVRLSRVQLSSILLFSSLLVNKYKKKINNPCDEASEQNEFVSFISHELREMLRKEKERIHSSNPSLFHVSQSVNADYYHLAQKINHHRMATNN